MSEDTFSLDDQFLRLLHKKIMHKRGAAKRQAKCYYKALYRKTGILPKPLQLADQGIMEGRKCSGRLSVLKPAVIQRFITMVKASADRNDARFIFITQRARKIKNYHFWLEKEFDCTLSRTALNRCARREGLKRYLQQPDYEEETSSSPSYFNPVPVFDLVQVDGCQFQYLKIKNDRGQWEKPLVIEFFDTGSRYMLVLDAYFTESSENSVRQFSKFLLSTPLPDKKIRLRPDNSRGFLNLKRPIREFNRRYSVEPGRFYLDADFTGVCAPKHKPHLESSHRTLHNFEIRIIKHFESKIIKQEPGFLFKGGRKINITVTLLDIKINEIRQSGLLEDYRREHNAGSHSFSERGTMRRWIPEQKLKNFLDNSPIIEPDAEMVGSLMKYGFDKKTAKVSKAGLITYHKQIYVVTAGAEKFSKHQSTQVKVSHYQEDKLVIFEQKEDGVLLGEALRQGPSKIPESAKTKAEQRLKNNQIDHIVAFLEANGMQVNHTRLTEYYHQGLTLADTKKIYEKNRARYDHYAKKITSKGQDKVVLFNAFLIDIQRYRKNEPIVPYAQSRTNCND